MTRKRIYNYLYLLFFFGFFFMPRSFEYISGLSFLYSNAFFFQCGFLMLSVIMYISIAPNLYNKSLFFGIIVFLMANVLVCAAHGGDYNIVFHIAVHFLAIFFVVSYELKKHTDEMISFSAWFFTILITINLIILILKPEGIAVLSKYSIDQWYRQIDRMNFLEVDNRLCLPIGFAILSTFLQIDKGKVNKALCLIAIIVGGLTNIITQSGTGIIGYTIFVLYIFFVYIRKYEMKLINVKNIVIVYAISTLLIVYASNISAVQVLINDILHKDMTFSGRIYIWDICLQQIKSSPFIGYGNFNSGWVIMWHGIERNAHNIFLDVVYEGGILLLTGFVIMLAIILKKLSAANSKKSQLLLVFLFSIFIVMLCESFLDNNYLYLFYSLTSLCYLESIEQKKHRRRVKIKW